MTFVNRSALAAENSAWMEEQERLYKQDPALLDPSWRTFFETGSLASSITSQAISHSSQDAHQSEILLDTQVKELVNAYRSYGHLVAHCNPMAQKTENYPDVLKTHTYTALDETSDRLVDAFGFFDAARVPFSQLIEKLKQIYCGVTGFEYMDCGNAEIEHFIQQQLERPSLPFNHTPEEKLQILHQINRSELFERFLHRHYTGQKRFSLEGGETLIPLLYTLIEKASGIGYNEFIIGMAHRGRLNVLANVVGKPYQEIFAEFEEDPLRSPPGTGDVKYHKGFTVERKTDQGTSIKISLCPNPSHLESVYPVVEGIARARLVQLGEWLITGKKVLPIVLHGDGALAGQGVVYETLQMAQLDGYQTGGTVHFVINNQIGFTTPPSQARSTRYCTDIARAFGVPVFHVNAEYPEECLFVTHLALFLRHTFGIDVFIDLNCYRKYGHNETDEPAFTQPAQAQWIRKRPSIRDLYRDQLHSEGVDPSLTEKAEKSCEEALEKAFQVRKEFIPLSLVTAPPESLMDTTVPQKQLLALTEMACQVPEGFLIHPKIAQLYKNRLQMAQGSMPCDWGMAEMLAMAVILSEGVDIRLTGQDCARGTFSHRHALWVDQEKEVFYYPLAHLSGNQGRFDVYNSLLSEYASLGFEFGYSVASPEACVFWEAQFGDFANGAQIMIDQYIAAAEQKWGLNFDLILLLPHGYEGQGPEHSSARIERFLSLCGHDNMYVTHPTTPAQLFHLLRRQQKSTFHKPLIIFTPKGLLRHPECISNIDELAQGAFQEVIAEEPFNAEVLVVCSGRFYYDLRAEKAKREQNNIAFVRIEQLYPVPTLLSELLKRYKKAKRFVFAQEEPENMGAWSYMDQVLRAALPDKTWEFIGRKRSASPAVGSYAKHRLEHDQLMDALFDAKKGNV